MASQSTRIDSISTPFDQGGGYCDSCSNKLYQDGSELICASCGDDIEEIGKHDNSGVQSADPCSSNQGINPIFTSIASGPETHHVVDQVNGARLVLDESIARISVIQQAGDSYGCRYTTTTINIDLRSACFHAKETPSHLNNLEGSEPQSDGEPVAASAENFESGRRSNTSPGRRKQLCGWVDVLTVLLVLGLLWYWVNEILEMPNKCIKLCVASKT